MDVDPATFAACLQDLERINRWTGAYRITLGWLDRLQEVHDCGGSWCSTPARAMATCCGGSARGGEARGLRLELIGVDRSRHAAAAAAKATARPPAVRYITADVF